MAKQTINIGSTANDGTGDPLRTAFNKANENFTEIYDIANSAFAQANTGSGNPFDQDLNTSNNVTFNEITVSSNTTANSYKLNTSAGVDVGVGEIAWNSSDGTIDIGLNYGGVVLQVGQEIHYVVRNATGDQILNGTAVYCSGVTDGSNRIEIDKMESTLDPILFMGLATQDINNGVNGVVTHFGYVRGLDTRGTANTALSDGLDPGGWQVGDKLYVHPTAPGKLTKVEPEAPNVKICVASVMNRNETAGVLFVRPTTNLTLPKLSDVQIDTPQANELLQYVSANSRWENTSDISANTITFSVLVVANLTSIGTTAGKRTFVSDSNVEAIGNFGEIVAGGGANTVPVYADGSTWRIG
jgi:hypothetical protein